MIVHLQPYLAWVGPHPVEQNGIDISAEVIWAFCPAILIALHQHHAPCKEGNQVMNAIMRTYTRINAE
eukprot:COSAG01_NODE_36496_length_517_cov_0.473684_1_plen_67_part_10